MPLLSSDSARYCVLPARNRPATSQIFLYFGSLTLLIYLATPSGNLVDIATSYMLKNRLHATASQVSMFRLLTGIPAYIAFVFGLARDLWSPFGLRDRGYFLCFAPIAAVSFLWMLFTISLTRASSWARFSSRYRSAPLPRRIKRCLPSSVNRS